MNEPIRVAVVDDSAFVRKAVSRVLESVDDIEVVGLARSGEELLEKLDEWSPTAVTLDLSMPGIGGLATLERILAWRQLPVVVLSAQSRRDAPLALEALARGAAEFVDKEQFSLVDFQSLRGVLTKTLRALAKAPIEPVAPPPPAKVIAPPPSQQFDCVVIGASTGGPPAIEEILRGLGTAPPVPIAIVQHMPAGFTTAFAERLNALLPFAVQEAVHGAPFVAGTVYIAPAGVQLRIRREGERLTTVLSRYPETLHRPNVDVLFRSAAGFGARCLGVLLSGMGEDGAQGMAELRRAGAFTIGQDEASCVVYGMPRAAYELGAVCEQLPLASIAPRLKQLLTPADALSCTPRSTASR